MLKSNKKRISRQQSGLINVTNAVGNGHSTSGSTSSSTKSRATFPLPRAPNPAFGSPLQRDGGLAEEEGEYAAVHGDRRADGDEDIELERASGRGKKKRTLAQAQAEEALAEAGREREKCRIRKDFVAAQRLQDVTNHLVLARLFLLSTQTFSVFCYGNITDSFARPRPPTNAARYRFRHAFVRAHIMQLDSPATADTRHYTGTVSPSYPVQFGSATITVPGCRCRGCVDDDRP